MAIEVPRINPIQPQSSTSRPQQSRINIQIPDSAQSIQGRTQALGQLGQQGANVFQAVEDEKITILSREIEREYSAWNKNELQRLKQIEGDPTQAYVEYEKKSKEKQQELLGRTEGVSSRIQRRVTASVNETVGASKLDARYQRGAQMETYKHNLFESTVALKRNMLADKAGFIVAGDPSTYAPIEKVRADLVTEIAKRGIEQQTVTVLPEDAESYSHSWQEVDENGELKTVKVQMSNIAKLRVAKELSTGLTDSIDALIASGQVEAAKEMKQKYAGFIDAKNEAKLDRRFKTEDTKASGAKLWGEIRNLPEAERRSQIENIKDEETRQEVLKIQDSEMRRREAERKRQQDANYDVLAKRVLNGNYYGEADLENDKYYKQTWERLSAKQQKAIKEMVTAPKKTKRDSEIKIQKLILGDDPNYDLGSISIEKFHEEFLVGLNDVDRRKYLNQFNKYRTETVPEQRSRNKRAFQFVKSELLNLEEIDLNDYGKLDQDELNILTRINNTLIDQLDTVSGQLSDKQLKDISQMAVKAYVEEKAFRIPPNLTRRSGVTTSPVQELSVPEKRRLKSLYYNEFGSFPDTNSAEFEKFVRERTQ